MLRNVRSEITHADAGPLSADQRVLQNLDSHDSPRRNRAEVSPGPITQPCYRLPVMKASVR